MNRTTLLFSALAAICIGDANAETRTLTCEHWNNNLGRLPDKAYAIDFDARTCQGQPCEISDREFVWRMDSGSHEWRIDRSTGEGTRVVLLGSGKSQEIDRFKNCRLASTPNPAVNTDAPRAALRARAGSPVTFVR